jgi:PAS domain S-box-containing protein
MNNIKLKIASSRLALVFIVAIISTVFISEILIMEVLHTLDYKLQTFTTALVDAFILVILIFPAFYYFLYKPLKNKQLDLEEAVQLQTQHLVSTNEELEKEISERMRAEQVIKESEQRYRSIVSSALVGVFQTRTTGEFLYANSALAEICEYESVDELLKNKAFSFYKNPEDREKLIAILKKEGKVSDYEFISLTNNGNEKTLIISVTLEGDILNGVLIDISQRKEIENSLRHKSEIIDQIHDSVITMDISGYIASWNKGSERLYGFSVDEMLTEHISVLFPPKYKSELDKKVFDPLKKNGLFEIETICQTKGGIKIDTLWSMALIFENKKPVGMISYSIDITDRKKAERDLIESEERLRVISEATFEGILFSHEGKIIDCNERFGELLGYSVSDLIGMALLSLVHPDSSELVVNKLKSKSTVPYEIVALKKDGSRVQLEICAQTLFYQGRDVRISAIRDITERNRSERSARLASIGELAASVAHEINNPTHSIMLNSQLLTDYSNIDENKRMNIARSIKEDTERIANIVSSLLSFSRDYSSEKSLIPIKDIIKDITILSSKHLSKSSVKLEISIKDEMPDVFVNKQQIEQVLINLISNSIYSLNQKYPEPDNNKLIKIHIDKKLIDDRMYTVWEYMDYGMGISQSMLQKIKEPFFSTKPEGQGTGLGLSVSNRIITNHGGKLVISSIEGEYTKVEFTLQIEGDQ